MTTSTVEPLSRIWAGTTTIHVLIQDGPITQSAKGSPVVTILPACPRIAARADNTYGISNRMLMPVSATLATMRLRATGAGRGKVCPRCLAALEAALSSPGPDGTSEGRP